MTRARVNVSLFTVIEKISLFRAKKVFPKRLGLFQHDFAPKKEYWGLFLLSL